MQHGFVNDFSDQNHKAVPSLIHVQLLSSEQTLLGNYADLAVN